MVTKSCDKLAWRFARHGSCGIDRPSVNDDVLVSIFGSSSIKRNTIERTCVGCGQVLPPGAGVKTWCKRHKHIVWMHP